MGIGFPCSPGKQWMGICSDRWPSGTRITSQRPSWGHTQMQHWWDWYTLKGWIHTWVSGSTNGNAWDSLGWGFIKTYGGFANTCKISRTFKCLPFSPLQEHWFFHIAEQLGKSLRMGTGFTVMPFDFAHHEMTWVFVPLGNGDHPLCRSCREWSGGPHKLGIHSVSRHRGPLIASILANWLGTRSGPEWQRIRGKNFLFLHL